MHEGNKDRNRSKSEYLRTLPQTQGSTYGRGAATALNGTYTGVEVAIDEEEWKSTGSEKEYLPDSEDVGCVLKVVVCAISISDGRVLAGPLFSHTDPVLSAPRPPPKR